MIGNADDVYTKKSYLESYYPNFTFNVEILGNGLYKIQPYLKDLSTYDIITTIETFYLRGDKEFEVRCSKHEYIRDAFNALKKLYPKWKLNYELIDAKRYRIYERS